MPIGTLILFLDFDGVLNNDPFLRHQKNHTPPSCQRFFDPVNIASLNSLFEVLPIEKIVISSSWRKNRALNEIQRLLTAEGFEFSERVHDITPDFCHLSHARGKEILDWIEKNRASAFVVLDDFDLSESFQKGFFRVNSSTGLTQELVSFIAMSLRERSD